MADFIECRGVKLPRDARVISDKIARRLQRDMYETPEVLGLSRYIKPSDRILELGAGIGFVSSYVATQLEARQVTCVEANPALCGYIRRVHEANGVTQAEVINTIALSGEDDWPEDGTVPFFVTEPFCSSSMIRPQDADAVHEVRVPASRLSDLIARVKPTVIVCDIEGGEETQFCGVDMTGVRAVSMELHTRIYGGQGIRNTFQAMHDQDFFYHQKASCADVVLFERLDDTRT